MPPTPESTGSPQARPYWLYTSAELGEAFRVACRVAVRETRSAQRGGIAGWTRHPAVEEVLDEFLLRAIADVAEEEQQMRLFDGPLRS